MAGSGEAGRGHHGEHIDWVRTRITLDQELYEWIRHGTVLIAAGFGSFALFEGVHVGEAGAVEMPREFALAVTAVGIFMVVSAIFHGVRMTRWVDEEKFGRAMKPILPDERRPLLLGTLVALIGLISCVALLRLPG